MAMDPDKLAEEIRDALGHKDQPVSDQTKAFAKAVVNALKSATTVNPSVVGVTKAGSPLDAGSAMSGKILGLVPPKMAADIASGMGGPPTAQVLTFAAAIVTHLSTVAQVNFAPGTVKGTCTSTSQSPGPLSGGSATGGKIESLDGGQIASVAAAGLGGPATPELEKMCKAIADHIGKNAEVSYKLIGGVCPPSAGPLVGLPAAGGQIA